jgi:hypothetical protein
MDSEEKPPISFTLALVVIYWFAWTVFQTGQLVYDRKNLEQVKINQESLYQQSVKTKTEIDAMAADTAKLAAQGNPNAQLIVNELKNRGITLSANIKPPTPSTP